MIGEIGPGSWRLGVRVCALVMRGNWWREDLGVEGPTRERDSGREKGACGTLPWLSELGKGAEFDSQPGRRRDSSALAPDAILTEIADNHHPGGLRSEGTESNQWQYRSGRRVNCVRCYRFTRIRCNEVRCLHAGGRRQDDLPCVGSSIVALPPRPIYCLYSRTKHGRSYHLHGRAPEWLLVLVLVGLAAYIHEVVSRSRIAIELFFRSRSLMENLGDTREQEPESMPGRSQRALSDLSKSDHHRNLAVHWLCIISAIRVVHRRSTAEGVIDPAQQHHDPGLVRVVKALLAWPHLCRSSRVLRRVWTFGHDLWYIPVRRDEWGFPAGASQGRLGVSTRIYAPVWTPGVFLDGSEARGLRLADAFLPSASGVADSISVNTLCDYWQYASRCAWATFPIASALDALTSLYAPWALIEEGMLRRTERYQTSPSRCILDSRVGFNRLLGQGLLHEMLRPLIQTFWASGLEEVLRVCTLAFSDPYSEATSLRYRVWRNLVSCLGRLFAFEHMSRKDWLGEFERCWESWLLVRLAASILAFSHWYWRVCDGVCAQLAGVHVVVLIRAGTGPSLVSRKGMCPHEWRAFVLDQGLPLIASSWRFHRRGMATQKLYQKRFGILKTAVDHLRLAIFPTPAALHHDCSSEYAALFQAPVKSAAERADEGLHGSVCCAFYEPSMNAADTGSAVVKDSDEQSMSSSTLQEVKPTVLQHYYVLQIRATHAAALSARGTLATTEMPSYATRTSTASKAATTDSLLPDGHSSQLAEPQYKSTLGRFSWSSRAFTADPVVFLVPGLRGIDIDIDMKVHEDWGHREPEELTIAAQSPLNSDECMRLASSYHLVKLAIKVNGLYGFKRECCFSNLQEIDVKGPMSNVSQLFEALTAPRLKSIRAEIRMKAMGCYVALFRAFKFPRLQRLEVHFLVSSDGGLLYGAKSLLSFLRDLAEWRLLYLEFARIFLFLEHEDISSLASSMLEESGDSQSLTGMSRRWHFQCYRV
ncbi:hypothetical protein OE88DRAFT_1727440 [Heliocybe sulcata]|uniref:Uncharacterized protein n=1 Tax=Heliocybe sulcata TaxID=5364 RepID=A0A5C3MZD3_9AGAM|nr:hypothetical protein OE88DRAFT_1727440 [Heliocybe sulcata]